jgi:hypothetical protein
MNLDIHIPGRSAPHLTHLLLVPRTPTATLRA